MVATCVRREMRTLCQTWAKRDPHRPLPPRVHECDNRVGCCPNSRCNQRTRAAYAEPPLISKPLHERWEPQFFRRVEPAQIPRVPALAWLRQVPDEVEAEIMATIDAVADGPPPRFRGGLRYVAMHGDMTGWFEARTKHQKRLYRLFCLQDRRAPGLPGPSLVMVTGGSKQPRQRSRIPSTAGSGNSARSTFAAIRAA